MRNATYENLLRPPLAIVILLATALLGIGEKTATLTVMSAVAIIVSTYVTDTKKIFALSQGAANGVALAVVAVSATNAYYLDRHGLMIVVADLQSYLQYVLLFQPKSARVYWQLALLSLGQVAIASTLVPGPTFGIVLVLYFFAGAITFSLLLSYTEHARFESRQSPSAHAGAGSPARKAILWGGSAARGSKGLLSLVEHAAFITVVSVGSTAVLFFLLPRWTVPKSETTSSEPVNSIGFSKKVTLGELKEVVKNPELVMRISFYRSHGTVPFKLAHDPLLRGTVLTNYHDGEWSQSKTASPANLSTDAPTPYVRQRITVEPLDVNELFCVFPVFAAEQEYRLKMDLNFDQLLRQEEERNRRLDFELLTTGIHDDRQRTFVACSSVVDADEQDQLLQIPKDDDQSDPFPGLRETAASALREKGIDPADHVAAAKALADHLRMSGRYFYSLEPTNRDPRVDPLEDFVTRHPVGHCEFFAGALVMMLRTQGIPARMAVGFKGGEWNPLGGYYQVQQLHAHTWVEVYLAGDKIPESAFAGDDEPPDAAWMLVDPTDGSQESGVAERNTGLLARARQILDYANVLWINYVAGLNSKRQAQGIYEPLSHGVSAAFENLVSPQVWQGRFRAVANSPLGTFWEWYRRHWFSWRGGLVAGGFSLAIAFCYLMARWFVRRLHHGIDAHARGEAPRDWEIYRRLETALAARGFSRPPAQTPYEFAVLAGGELAESIEHRRVAHLPRRIVEAFYRVRFGGRTLDDREALAVEHALTELELALVPAR